MNELKLELIDELATKIVEAKFGRAGAYVKNENGDIGFTGKAEYMYIRVHEDVESLLNDFIPLCADQFKSKK